MRSLENRFRPVPERHVLVAYGRRERWHLASVGLFDDLVLAVDDLEDAARGGERDLHRHVDACDVLERLVHEHQSREEGEEIADLHPVRVNLPRRVDEESRQADPGQDLHPRGVGGLEPDRSPVRPEVSVVRFRKTPRLERLHRVGLDQPLAFQCFREKPADLPDALPGARGGAAQPPRIDHDRQQHDRREQDDDQRQTRVERKDVNEHEQKSERPLDQIGQAVAERGLDLLDVGEHAAHQFPGRRLGVEARGLAEQPVVRVSPQVADHGDADPVELVFGQVRKHVLDDEREKQEQRRREADRDVVRFRERAGGRVSRVERAQERGCARRSRMRQARKPLGGPGSERVVDDLSDEKEHRDGGGRDNRHRQEGEQSASTIMAEVDEETPEGFHE